MDAPALLARFRDAARDRLVRMADALREIEARAARGIAQGPVDPDAIFEEPRALLAREVHTLKVEARMMGFADLARVAHGIEEVIEAQDRIAWRDPAAAVDSLSRAFEFLVDLVDESSPAAAARPAASIAPRAPIRPASMVRIPFEKLDALADVSGDMFLGGARAEEREGRLKGLAELAARQSRAAASLRRALEALSPALPDTVLAAAADELASMAGAMRRALQDAARDEHDEALRARRSVAALEARLRDLRFLPVGALFDDYAAIVGTLARELGREARIVASGDALEIDRRMLEALRDPLVHLVQNAVDHGIEPPDVRVLAGKPARGTVTLAARMEEGGGGTMVVIEIADDGAGIDLAAIRRAAIGSGLVPAEASASLSDDDALELIFRPGFSSRRVVTATSGRGIGLDVVRDRVERLGGSVRVESSPGIGTRFILRIPLETP